MWRSGDVSADETAGGNGWINLGTTTRSLPKTSIAPALFAVPVYTKLQTEGLIHRCAEIPNTQNRYYT